MNIKIKSFLKMGFICIAATAITLTACKDLDGNETTYPVLDGQEEECEKDDSCVTTPYILEQAHLICTKINLCLGVNAEDPKATCTNLLPVQNGLENFVATSARNYNQLNQLYKKKKLTVDGRNYEQCLAAIDLLTCDSAVFTSAFNVNDSNNYSQIHQILTTNAACGLIYSPK